jgi:hypothetical protein
MLHTTVSIQGLSHHLRQFNPQLSHHHPQIRIRFLLYTFPSTYKMSDPSSLNLQLLFDAALKNYENQTGMKLVDHPLAKQLEDCHSVNDISDILLQQDQAFTEFCGENSKIERCIKRAVNVFHALCDSTILGEGIGLVCRMAISGIPAEVPNKCSFH